VRRRLLEYLVCPACGADLACSEAADQGEIVEGLLTCSRCAAAFPIRRGIPRLLVGELATPQRRTVDAFGWEWQTFSHLAVDERKQFLDWIDPLGSEFFVGKVVLDAGCGMGRFAVASAAFGARDVLAVDLSDAVEAAADNARAWPNVHVVQADIYRLPFRRASVDFAFSIGVLHHLPDPERGFACLAEHVKPGGALFAWVYGRENNEWLVRLVNPIRERVCSRLPRQVLYGVSFVLALGLHLLSRLARARRLPYGAYLRWLGEYGFRHTHHVVFDHLVAPTAFYIRREEFAAWFDRAGLAAPALSWRNQNSWRGFALRRGP
jgi:SAM-dependent methyltransferase